MKAVRIKEMTGMNPAFSVRDYYRAQRAGREYEIPLEVTYKEGSVVEGPEVVIQCVLPNPTMIPADKECHDAVMKRLGKMKARLEKLRKLAAPEVLEGLPSGLQKYVRVLSEKWDGSRTEAIIKGELTLPFKEESGETNE